jgi:hypothetical protein
MQQTTRRSLRAASRSPLLGNLHHTTHIPHIAPAWKKSTLLGTLVCLSQLSKPTLFFRCIAGIVTFLIQFCDINILGASHKAGMYKQLACTAVTGRTFVVRPCKLNGCTCAWSTTFADRISALDMDLVASRGVTMHLGTPAPASWYARYAVGVAHAFGPFAFRAEEQSHHQYQEWAVHLLLGAPQTLAAGPSISTVCSMLAHLALPTGGGAG